MVKNHSRQFIVITFLALLDMVKQQLISISQDIDNDEDIVVGEFVAIPDIEDQESLL